MKIKDLYKFLNEKYPKSLSCEWDNDGIMCISDEEREVKKVLVCLDVTEKAAEYAIGNGYDTIISHHPLVFKPLKGIDPENNVSRKLIKLIKNDVSVLSFHTRLDAADGGVNDAISEKIGLSDVKCFGSEGIDMGRIGNLDKECEFEQFIQELKKTFNCPSVTAVKVRDFVSKVAVLGGEGKDFYNSAKAAGADTFITGDASYNFLSDSSEYSVNVICLGHFYSEDVVCKNLNDQIKTADRSICVNYFYSNNVLIY